MDLIEDTLAARFDALDIKWTMEAVGVDGLNIDFSAEKPDDFVRRLIELSDVNFREPVLSEDGSQVMCSGPAGDFAVAPTSLMRGQDEQGRRTLYCVGPQAITGNIEWEAPRLTGGMIQSASLMDRPPEGPGVGINFGPDGSALFAEITGRLQPLFPLGIFFGDQLISAPTVQSQIIGGSTVVTGLEGDQQLLLFAVASAAAATGSDLQIPVVVTSIGPVASGTLTP